MQAIMHIVFPVQFLGMTWEILMNSKTKATILMDTICRPGNTPSWSNRDVCILVHKRKSMREKVKFLGSGDKKY